MTLQQIFDLAIKLGVQTDLRGATSVNKRLKRLATSYEKLPSEAKKDFDKEKLTNPYPDTRILTGDPSRQIKKILVGIDMEVGEVMLADRLGGFDLVLSHHPEGVALADLSEVMHLQAEVLAGYGVPINIGERLTEERLEEVSKGISPVNTNRAVDAAKLLGLSMMSTHTVTDNLAANFLDKAIKQAKPETLGEILEVLKAIPEYQQSTKNGTGPRLFVGKPDSMAGKIVLTEITGGTEGAVGIYEKMAQYGIGTIVGMHMSLDRRKEATQHHINVVNAGHMSSDSLGMNLLLDEIEKRGVEVVSTSGLIRVKRFTKKSAPKRAAKKAVKKVAKKVAKKVTKKKKKK